MKIFIDVLLGIITFAGFYFFAVVLALA